MVHARLVFNNTIVDVHEIIDVESGVHENIYDNVINKSI